MVWCERERGREAVEVVCAKAAADVLSCVLCDCIETAHGCNDWVFGSSHPGCQQITPAFESCLNAECELCAYGHEDSERWAYNHTQKLLREWPASLNTHSSCSSDHFRQQLAPVPAKLVCASSTWTHRLLASHSHQTVQLDHQPATSPPDAQEHARTAVAPLHSPSLCEQHQRR